MGEDNSAITFESLYDLVRKEKASETIQVLNPLIYNQIVDYLRSKTEIYRNAKEKNTFNESDLEKMKTQIISAKKLIKEFYERRERKLLQLAVNMSRVKTSDDAMLLEGERLFLGEVTKILDKYRDEILLNLVNSKLPFISNSSYAKAGPEKKSQVNEASVQVNTEVPASVRLRFVHDVPKFLGENMEIFGPFSSGNEAELPKLLADILIGKGAAVKIQ